MSGEPNNPQQHLVCALKKIDISHYKILNYVSIVNYSVYDIENYYLFFIRQSSEHSPITHMHWKNKLY